MTNTSPEESTAETSQPATNQTPNHPIPNHDATAEGDTQQSPDAAREQTQPSLSFNVGTAKGKRIALIATAMLLFMQVLVTLVVLVSQPMAAPDIRAWLFVISSWLLAGIVLAAVWQIAVFSQQAQLRFEETGLQVSRPGIIGIFTRRVLLPYGQLRKVRFDLCDYPEALETSVISEQRSIVFDLLNLRQRKQHLAVATDQITAEQLTDQLTKQLSNHPFVQALQARDIPLEIRTDPQADWQALEV